MAQFETYRHKYRNMAFERRGGVTQVSLHSNGGPLKWGGDPGSIHGQLGEAFFDIAHDSETRVLILTGTGNVFCNEFNNEELTEKPSSAMWYRLVKEAKDMLMQLLDIDAPVIGVINGPATIHAEFPLLSDIVLAADDAVFADCHLPRDIIPGDGAQIVWAELIGANRARYLLYAEKQLTALEALTLGLVGEILPREHLLPRAWTLAENLVRKPPVSLRYTRALLTHQLKKKLLDYMDYGLAVEGLGLNELMTRTQT